MLPNGSPNGSAGSAQINRSKIFFFFFYRGNESGKGQGRWQAATAMGPFLDKAKGVGIGRARRPRARWQAPPKQVSGKTKTDVKAQLRQLVRELADQRENGTSWSGRP